MKKQLLAFSLLSLALVSCDNHTNHKTYDADDTGRNVRDRSSQAITPGDQSESSADRTITQNIRHLIVDDKALSNNAKNIKIVTINGQVTLRGPVNSEQEKAAINKYANQVSGVVSVNNELEITSSK